jgi:aerobic-type carbon monoxide dehydrogenase small subunit (CoxS/CutS family)
MTSLELTINNERRVVSASPGDTLLEVLRREGYVGVKKGCGSGDCGACTVLLDGRAVNACLVLAATAEKRTILTIEGLANGGALHPIQEAFLDEGAVQCGYCTPGMVLSAYDLLSRNLAPSEGEIREAISGNLCRCTGYVKQVRAIHAAAERMRSGRNE